MKILTPRAILLGASLLSVGTFFTATNAEAQPRYGNRYGQPRYGTRRPARRPGVSRQSSFTGVVTNVRSSSNFDIRVAGKTYNVYTTYRTPRRLNSGDRVRVTGRPMYSNDIRDAAVTILRNR